MPSAADALAANKALVRTALTAAFVDRDLSAIERHFADDYKQHNPMVAGGAGGLAEAVKALPPLCVEWGIMVAEGDLVASHSRWTGLGPDPLIVFDLFRIRDGKLAEHWDVMQVEIPADATLSGVAMFEPGEG